jgi:hypothetical protein
MTTPGLNKNQMKKKKKSSELLKIKARPHP